MQIGVISDTHGLLRAEALQCLRDSDLIIHAGDIGSADIVSGLAELAETHAIRGNVDTGAWAEQFPSELRLTVAGKTIFVLHNLKELNFDPAEQGIDVVIAGHSHKPLVKEDKGVLYLNPGSAGPRRFKLPIAVASLNLDEAKPTAEIKELSV